MKYSIFLTCVILCFTSCDTINYKQPIPTSGSAPLVAFPKKYRGVFVESSKREDTLFVGSKYFYLKNKPIKNEAKNSLDINGKIGEELVLKEYQNNILVNYKFEKKANHWNTRYIKFASGNLYIYKLSPDLDVKNTIYDYTFNSETKKYTINPTNRELDKLYFENQFKLNKTFVKVYTTLKNSKPLKQNPKLIKGCVSGNCQHGFGIFNYENGDGYYGLFKNGKRHGYGSYIWKNRDFYSGNWENNVKSGIGTYLWNNDKKQESLYFGEWKNDVIAGYGYKTNVDLTYSRGVWQNGNLISSYKFNSNTATVGCVKGNCKNGYGKYIYAKTGDKYEGFFINGIRLVGKFTYANGDNYKGRFDTNGYREGTGVYAWKDGRVFQGQWIDGKRNGLGIYKDENGKRFVEEWSNGKRITTNSIKK